MSRKSTCVLVLFFCSQASLAQKAELVKLDRLQTLIGSKDQPVQVINFWATWCAPCVKELPLLEKLNRERNDVRVTLVSIDRKSTRLNSSHTVISYAVFCLKKKKTTLLPSTAGWPERQPRTSPR